MGIDFNFNNLDIGDYKIKDDFHDIIVDMANTLNRLARPDSSRMTGELDSFAFDPLAGTATITGLFHVVNMELTDAESFYSWRLYGGKIILRPENDMEFTIVAVLYNCFEKKEDDENAK